MRRGLDLADLGDLLELRIVAVLATYRSDGEILIVIRLEPGTVRAWDFADEY